MTVNPDIYIRQQKCDFVTECVMQIVKSRYLYEDRQYITESVGDITVFAKTLSNVLSNFKKFCNTSSAINRNFPIMMHFKEVSKSFRNVTVFLSKCKRLMSGRAGALALKVYNGATDIANEIVTKENGVEIWISDLAIAKQFESVKNIIVTAVQLATSITAGWGTIACGIIAGVADALFEWIVYGETNIIKLAGKFFSSFYESAVPGVVKKVVSSIADDLGDSFEEGKFKAQWKERFGTMPPPGEYQKEKQRRQEQEARNNSIRTQKETLDMYVEYSELHSWREFSEYYASHVANGGQVLNILKKAAYLASFNGNIPDTIKIIDNPNNIPPLYYVYADDYQGHRKGDYIYFLYAANVVNAYEAWKKSFSDRDIDKEDEDYVLEQQKQSLKVDLYDIFKECSEVLKSYHRNGLIPALIFERLKVCLGESYETNETFFNRLENAKFNATFVNEKATVVDSIWDPTVVVRDGVPMIHPGIESTCDIILSQPNLKWMSKKDVIAQHQSLVDADNLKKWKQKMDDYNEREFRNRNIDLSQAGDVTARIQNQTPSFQPIQTIR